MKPNMAAAIALAGLGLSVVRIERQDRDLLGDDLLRDPRMAKVKPKPFLISPRNDGVAYFDSGKPLLKRAKRRLRGKIEGKAT